MSIDGIVPKEEVERVHREYLEHLKTHPYPSCSICRNRQVDVLKYRKYRGEITIMESERARCRLGLDFEESTFPPVRATKCEGYERGDSEYIMPKKQLKERP